MFGIGRIARKIDYLITRSHEIMLTLQSLSEEVAAAAGAVINASVDKQKLTADLAQAQADRDKALADVAAKDAELTAAQASIDELAAKLHSALNPPPAA